MRLGLLAFALVIAQPSSLSEPVKIEELAKPPANAKEYIILSTAGVHGHSYCWTDAEGIRYGRESMLLRGQAFESDSKACFVANVTITAKESFPS